MEGSLADYWFVEYDVRNDVIETFNPVLAKEFYYGECCSGRSDPDHLDCRVVGFLGRFPQ